MGVPSRYQDPDDVSNRKIFLGGGLCGCVISIDICLYLLRFNILLDKKLYILKIKLLMQLKIPF